MSQLLHIAKTTSHITSRKVQGLMPASTRWQISWAPQPFLHGMGLIHAEGLLPHWLGHTSLIYPAFSLSWHASALLLLQGPGAHLSCSTTANTAAPETSSAAWRNPRGLCKIKAVLGVSWGRAREKGLDFCNFIHVSFGKYFLPLRLALMLLMVPWTHYIESIKIHISDFLPLKNEDLLYTTIKPCPQR